MAPNPVMVAPAVRASGSREQPQMHGSSRVPETSQLLEEIRALQRQVHDLEQLTLAQPTPRETYLEITLEFMWKDFCRVGSAETQPGSAFWRMLQMHAPHVLGIAPAPLPPVTQGPQAQVWNTATMPFEEDMDWTQFVESAVWASSSKAAAIDSGYGSEERSSRGGV
ncbi:hypothetical protein CBER1_07175 [Cercospora berteroae]|uniref:Uncharacterized protein n=1 Tax=Cercospora berteroae TaxID=357750 RepID=A0A2S6BRX4_9PEZI|nr:hypothetical protein CBER1_07175 [Cercospora berteroae]